MSNFTFDESIMHMFPELLHIKRPVFPRRRAVSASRVSTSGRVSKVLSNSDNVSDLNKVFNKDKMSNSEKLSNKDKISQSEKLSSKDKTSDSDNDFNSYLTVWNMRESRSLSLGSRGRTTTGTTGSTTGAGVYPSNVSWLLVYLNVLSLA